MDIDTSTIGNKQKRSEVARKLKTAKAKEKRERRQQIKKDEEQNPKLKEERWVAWTHISALKSDL